MASWKTDRSYPGKTAGEIYQAAKKTIDQLAGKYGLRHQNDDAGLSGKVGSKGVEAMYRAAGDKLSVEIEYSFLFIGPLREKVQNEVGQRLEKLFG